MKDTIYHFKLRSMEGIHLEKHFKVHFNSQNSEKNQTATNPNMASVLECVVMRLLVRFIFCGSVLTFPLTVQMWLQRSDQLSA